MGNNSVVQMIVVLTAKAIVTRCCCDICRIFIGFVNRVWTMRHDCSVD